MSAQDIFGTDPEYTTYQVRLRCRGMLVGGIPSGESIIRGWLRARLDMGDAHLEEIAQQVIANRQTALTVDERIDAIMESEHAPSVNGFLRDPDTEELVYEGRCMKAAIKEWANSAYPGTEWPGRTDVSKGFRKGLLATLAERVFVPDRYIGLGVKQPDRVEERVKHVRSPQGPVHTIARVEVIERPVLAFTLRVHDDFLPRQAWGRIWQRGEDIGIGADRGRSDGMFDLEAFDQVD